MAETLEPDIQSSPTNAVEAVITTSTVTPMDDVSDSANVIAEVGVTPEDNNVEEPEETEPQDRFQKEALARHNLHRRKHGVPPLKWCSNCAAKAQAHADEIAASGSIAHSNVEGFGESLFALSSSEQAEADAEKAVDAWYDEIRDMTFGEETPGDVSKVGHFTQLVWKGTTHVGVAYAKQGNSVYVVAKYLPAGNVHGKFHEHVLPASS